MYSIEELVNILLLKSEQLEEIAMQKTELSSLTAKQLNCIELIHSMHNPTLSELTKKLQTTKASSSVMLDRLEENGFIVKIKSDSDRRSAHVHLTEKGDSAAHLHTDVHKQFADRLTKELTDSEKEILKVLLNKAVNSMG